MSQLTRPLLRIGFRADHPVSKPRRMSSRSLISSPRSTVARRSAGIFERNLQVSSEVEVNTQRRVH